MTLDPSHKLRDDPVIVLGMHHSGTSILAEILHRNGVFMQANMRHWESKFFSVEINDQLIMGGGDGWAQNPILPVRRVMAEVARVRARIEKRAFKKYVEAGYDGHGRWGFKDPRSCVTLPLLLEIFPDARLLHIVRNEDDVALSLSKSDKQGLGVRTDFDFWKALRRQYLARARRVGKQHAHYYEFNYEEFCYNAADEMKPVFAYLGLVFSSATEEFLQKRIYTHRVNIGKTMQPC